MDMLKVIQARESLEAVGRYDDLLDDGGEIVPTPEAIDSVRSNSLYRDANEADLRQLAQAQTLLDLTNPAIKQPHAVL